MLASSSYSCGTHEIRGSNEEMHYRAGSKEVHYCAMFVPCEVGFVGP